MLARREAIESAGFLDERYFMYSDETDLCRRIKSAGWGIRHLPQMTIIHHDGKAGVKPSIESLNAYSRIAYARKHFSPPHRAVYWAAVMLRHSLRSVYAGSGELGRLRTQANRRVVATLSAARRSRTGRLAASRCGSPIRICAASASAPTSSAAAWDSDGECGRCGGCGAAWPPASPSPCSWRCGASIGSACSRPA